MPCRTSTGLEQHVSLLPGASSMSPLVHPREDRTGQDWAPGCVAGTGWHQVISSW